MGDDLLEVDLHAVHFHADVLALVLDVLHQFSGVQQALGGDAAHVQAGAAQILLFDQGDLGAQLRGPDGGHIAAGAAADDDHAGIAGGLCGSRGSGRGKGHCGSGSGRSTANLLAGLADPCQGALHGHIVALLGYDLQHGAFRFAGHFVGQLIGGDLHHNIADLYFITLMLDPLGDGTLLHGQAQLGHFQFKSHCLFLPCVTARCSWDSAEYHADPSRILPRRRHPACGDPE